MATPRPIRIEYTTQGNATGKTIKANVYVNGVSKAGGTSGNSQVTLVEVDATNSPGLQELVFTTAMLAGYGFSAGGENTISGVINPGTNSASPFRIQASYYTADEVMAILGTPAGASLAADIAAIQAKLGTPAGTTVSADIAALTASNTNVLTQLTALTNAAQSGAPVAAALPSFLTGSAANTIVVPFTLKNNAGALVNSSTPFTVGLKNAAGTDRGSYLTGSSGSPATVVAANPNTGQYNVTIVIPANAPEEELILSTTYTVNGQLDLKYYIAQLTVDPATSGYALQSTLTSVQTTVNTINSAVGNATSGLVALQAILANSTYGLSAMYNYVSSATTGIPSVLSLLNNATYGLSALGTQLGTAITNIAAVQSSVTAVQGAGFTAGTDDLHSLSAYVRANIFVGGKVA